MNQTSLRREDLEAVRETSVIGLDIKRVARVLVLLIGILAGASTAGQILIHYFGHDHVFGFIRLFDLNTEMNLPTWFSSLILWMCALALGVIAADAHANNDPWRRHWTGLAGIFSFLSADETAYIHELLGTPTKALLNTSGAFYFAWVIPAGIALLLTAAVYFRFLLALPAQTRNLFLSSAMLFVGGAIGMEMIGASWAEENGVSNITYAALFSLEEIFEMGGAALFLYSLGRHMVNHIGRLELHLSA